MNTQTGASVFVAYFSSFGWHLWKRLTDIPITVRLFNGLRLRVYSDCDTSPAAVYYSIPNGNHISFLRKHLDGGTFVDVGANVGLVSLLVADKVEHVVLFEPNPIAVKRAQENLGINRLNFEVFAQALSDVVGTVEFEHAGKPGSCNRTVDGFTTSVPTIRIRRTTLDQFLQDHPRCPRSVRLRSTSKDLFACPNETAALFEITDLKG
jgi:FkbM family methyltransferase